MDLCPRYAPSPPVAIQAMPKRETLHFRLIDSVIATAVANMLTDSV